MRANPAAFCRGLLAHRRQEREDGRISAMDLALQPPCELACGWFARHEYDADRFREILEERVLGAKDERVAVVCSNVLGAWSDPRRRRVLATFAEGPEAQPR